MHISPPRKTLAVFSLAVAFILLGGLSDARAQDRRTVTKPPLHPTVLRSAYNGRYYPIVAVKDDSPEIEVDGKLRLVDRRNGCEPVRAQAYAKGFVRFSAQNSTAEVGRLSSVSAAARTTGGTLSKSGTYEVTLLPTESHDDCYLAVIFFQQDENREPKAGTTAMAFAQIGTLTAGKPRKVSIDEAYVPDVGVFYHYFPQVFSKGAEIRSDQSELAARFFRSLEKGTHQKILASYLKKNPTANLRAQAYLRIPPMLPDEIDVKALPAVIHTTFMVSESGEVESLQIEDPVDLPVSDAIQRAVSGWLFTPKLENGRPTRIMIRLPLSFDPARS